MCQGIKPMTIYESFCIMWNLVKGAIKIKLCGCGLYQINEGIIFTFSLQWYKIKPQTNSSFH